MAVTHDVRPFPSQRRDEIGPQALFGGALLLSATAWIFATRTYSGDMTLPFVVTLIFGLAAVVALVAWARGSMPRHRVTYWDVAGALTFIGIGAAAMIDPEQMLRLVAASPGEIEAFGSRR